MAEPKLFFSQNENEEQQQYRMVLGRIIEECQKALDSNEPVHATFWFILKGEEGDPSGLQVLCAGQPPILLGNIELATMRMLTRLAQAIDQHERSN